MDQTTNLVQVRNLCKAFEWNTSTCKEIMDLLDNEMERGLAEATHPDADVKMFPSFVRSLPDGLETGDFLALDFGGTNLRILHVRLAPGQPMDTQSHSYLISDDLREGTGKELFDYFAQCINTFILHEDLSSKQLYLGFTFSFPCRQEGLNVATLTKWVKGFDCEGVVGKNVAQLLQEALPRNGVSNVQVLCVVNDTVGTLLAGARDHTDCGIGLIMATGCNACYMENLDHVGTWKETRDEPNQVVINMEWASFGENGCLDKFRTEFDKKLDKFSVTAGKEIMQKMIGGMYIGELVRLVLEWLMVKELLFTSVADKSWISEKHCFTAVYVSEIEQDTDGTFAVTKRILDDLQLIDTSLEDCRIVQHVCKLILERAAFLVASGLSTLINRINKSPLRVAVDGPLYHCNPRLQRVIRDKIKELVRPQQEFELVRSEDGSGKGAALTAAVALRLRNGS